MQFSFLNYSLPNSSIPNSSTYTGFTIYIYTRGFVLYLCSVCKRIYLCSVSQVMIITFYVLSKSYDQIFGCFDVVSL